MCAVDACFVSCMLSCSMYVCVCVVYVCTYVCVRGASGHGLHFVSLCVYLMFCVCMYVYVCVCMCMCVSCVRSDLTWVVSNTRLPECASCMRLIPLTHYRLAY